jgi:hypothetical protein
MVILDVVFNRVSYVDTRELHQVYLCAIKTLSLSNDEEHPHQVGLFTRAISDWRSVTQYTMSYNSIPIWLYLSVAGCGCPQLACQHRPAASRPTTNKADPDCCNMKNASVHASTCELCHKCFTPLHVSCRPLLSTVWHCSNLHANKPT